MIFIFYMFYKTALYASVKNGNKDVVRHLLSKEAIDVNFKIIKINYY